MTDEVELVARVRRGEREALSELVSLSRDLVFNLAIRMLGDPSDAEDASQEILIRVVSGLADFRGESSLKTWVYRVASNHLLGMRRRRTEAAFEDIEAVAGLLDQGLASSAPPVEDQLLVTEAKLHCTSHMMLGLDREHRLAFILGEVLDLSAEEASAVLQVSPEAYRKRLSRARERMAAFTRARCGLVDPARPCRCAKQMGHHVARGAFDPARRAFTRYDRGPDRLREPLSAIDDLTRALEVFRSHPDYRAPEAVTAGLRELLARGPFSS